MKTPSIERRQHVVFITDNSEYHCRNRECVGVRDRETGIWDTKHPALRSKLLGGMLDNTGVSHIPVVGYRLLFSGKQMVMTSYLKIMCRPPKESTTAYVSLMRSGLICA